MGLGWGLWLDVRIFQQLLCLGIVNALDLFIVEKVLLGAGVVVELEAVGVEGVVQFVTGDIVDGCRGCLDWLETVGCRIADVVGGWRGAVGVVFEVVQGFLDVARFILGCLDRLGGEEGGFVGCWELDRC